MSWNYRLCQYTVDGATLFGIREVYYNDDGTIKGTTRASADDWERPNDVRSTLERMQRAIEEPMLVLNGNV